MIRAIRGLKARSSPAHSRRSRHFQHSAFTSGTLGQNHRHGFALRHAMRIYPSNAVYTMIPKNACSTLRTAIAMANGCIDDVKQRHWIHRNNASFPVTNETAQLADFTFVVLRCPFRRLYSVFMDKIVGLWPPAWELYMQTDRQLLPYDISFRQFVEVLRDPAMIQADHHWRPQVSFLLYQNYDAYFRVEDMNTAEVSLLKEIGLSLPNLRNGFDHNISKLEKVDGDFADTAAFDLLVLKRDGRVPAIGSLFDDELKARASHLYRHDIALYTSLFGADGLAFAS